MSSDVITDPLPSRRALDRLALGLSDLTAVAASSRDILAGVAKGCAEAFDAVLARVWLMGPGDSCATCALRQECADRSRCLHLEVSAGITRHTDGPFRRFPVGARRVGQTAVTLEPYVVRGELSALGLAEPAWLDTHRVRGFAALPLLIRGELLGVLALFTRREWTAADAAALALAARLSANAIAAARAIAALEARGADAAMHLRPMSDLERDAIVRVLEHACWRVSGPQGAASILGLPPSTLASRMQKLGIRRPPRR